ncbi:MAG TPA: phenylacetate--CoA ligase [Candidatus Limnocylindrales bacterium]|nr:phenylacetate--CoA ligase [Candidatus Limnocylindrales bacterium]
MTMLPIERAPRAELEALQLARLRTVVAGLAGRPSLYAGRLSAAGVRPGDIRSLADLRRLPFTTKADFRDAYPYGLLAVPMDRVVRIHGSSGTTGKPTVVAYTRRDVETWTEVMARTLTAGGVAAGDVVHNAYGYGLFTGGLGFHYGAERVGAAVIPISGGFTDRQLMAFTDLGSTVLCCTPSYALYLAEAIEEAGIAAKDLKLRVGFFGAEPWTDGMRDTIEARLDLMALNIYGLSEVIGPGVSVECPERRGMHVAEDHFLPEIVDPDTLEPVPAGVTGELVFTTLTKEALPLVRYRTRDLTFIDPEPCACGRTLVRIGRITGRTDDMVIVRGVNVYPSQIEHALLQVPEVQPHYLLVLRREGPLDTLEVRVEGGAAVAQAGAQAMRALAAQVRRRIHEVIGLTAEVTVVAPKTIERSAGKARRVEDLRAQGGRANG